MYGHIIMQNDTHNANAVKQWINDQFHMNIQTKPLKELYIHSVLSFQVVQSFFQNQSNTRN